MSEYLDSIIHEEEEMTPSLENIEDSLQTDNTYDPVHKPSHYNRSNIQPKDVIRDWGLNFNVGSAVKYIARAGYKDDIVQDLSKSKEFIKFEIEALDSGYPVMYKDDTRGHNYDTVDVVKEWGLTDNLSDAIACVSIYGVNRDSDEAMSMLIGIYGQIEKEIQKIKAQREMSE